MEQNNKESCNGCHVNKGIHCDVKNCVYHNGDCHCTAEVISVIPHSATTSDETACGTFQQREF